MGRIKGYLALLTALLIGYLLFWPVPIEPYAWTPGENPGTSGPFVPNEDLAAAELLPATAAPGPEDVAFDGDGFLYTGTEDGAILRVDPKTGVATEWARTGGRPLGLAFDGELLYVADAEEGLLRVVAANGARRVETVVDELDGQPLGFTDGVAVASSGVVWFTSPSARFPLSQVRYDGMETKRTGRLLRHDPSTGMTEVALGGLMFANGVVLSPDEDYVLVAEWSGYRITRYWLTGPKAGNSDVFYENLPGFPDNLSLDPDGFYWVGLVIERSAALDRLHPHPFWMKVLPRIPESWQPQLRPFGWLLAIDPDGRIVHNLQATEKVVRVTGARRRGELLYVTSDWTDTLARIPVPPMARLSRVNTGSETR